MSPPVIRRTLLVLTVYSHWKYRITYHCDTPFELLWHTPLENSGSRRKQIWID